MARNMSGLKSALALSITLFAALATTAFAQSPALVQRDPRPFTPPDMQAPPPRATAPAQQQPPAQSAPAQAQPTATQMPSPASQGLATIAPAPLMQKPAVAPTVTMQNGLLSIDASNSNLSDVLTAVKRATGAAIEGASGATERVVVRLGPGRPNEVISALLSGSRYDYVLLGSPQQPGAVTRIMLTLRQGGDQGPAGSQAASNVPPPANVNNNPEDEGPQDDSPEQREQDVRPAEPPAEQQGNVQPAQPGQPGQPQNGAQPGAQNSDQPKTPQQLYEEIQRMQQQRQQDQQQEDQRPQQPPPPQE